MAIGRNILCSVKQSGGKKSILLERRNGEEVLFLEQNVTTTLSKKNLFKDTNIYYNRPTANGFFRDIFLRCKLKCRYIC